MADLNVSITADTGGLTTQLQKGSEAVKKLTDELDKQRQELNRHTVESQKARAELRTLNILRDEGKVTTERYKEENVRLRKSLEDIRTSTDRTQSNIRRLKLELDQAKRGSNGLTSSLTRQVYAQRTALSAANNLTHSLTAVASGSAGAAAGVGVLARQLALLSVMGRGAAGSLFAAFAGPAGVAIAISVAVTAITGWIAKRKEESEAARAQREEQEALNDVTKEYIRHLDTLESATTRGEINAQKELVELKGKVAATRDLNIPMERRRELAEELIKQYPKSLEGLNAEAVMAGKASDQFDRLADSLTNAAVASALASRMADDAGKVLDNRLRVMELNRKRISAMAALAEAEADRDAFDPGQYRESAAAGMLNLYNSRISKLNKEIEGLGKQLTEVGTDSANAAKRMAEYQKEYVDMLGKTVSEQTTVEGTTGRIADLTKEIAKVTADLELGALSAWDRQAETINQKYRDIFETLKLITDEERRARLERMADQARLREETQYRADRYLGGVTEAPRTGVQTSGQVSVPDILPGLENYRKQLTDATLTVFKSDEFSRSVQRSMVRGFARGIDQITGSITDLGSDFYQVFSNVFDMLAGTVRDTLTRVISTSLGEKVAEKFKSGLNIGSLSKEVSTALVAGVGLAGTLVQSMGSATSYGSQAVGGMVSGGAAGFAIGGPVGAVVGSILGGLGGIFSAKSARKAERQREQQLEEQRKQTAALERIRALAYSASVVGQMTVDGIVGGVDRDAYGRLVAQIKGRDIEIIQQRTQNSRTW